MIFELILQESCIESHIILNDLARILHDLGKNLA